MLGNYRYHIAFWIIVYIIHFALFFHGQDVFSIVIIVTINIATFTLIFYTNTLWIFPNFFSRKNFLLYGAFCLGLILAVTFVHSVFFEVFESAIINPPRNHHDKQHFKYEIITRHTIWLLFVYLISLIYSIQNRLNQQITDTNKLIEEKLQTELKLLKAQINPHFLFNALNNIYSLTYLKSEKAPESILKLSDMLRYIIEDCCNEKVLLKSEIEYIKNYIDFQKLKNPLVTNVIFKYDANISGIWIAPVLFAPFIENSFKYSRIDDFQDAFIHIGLHYMNHILSFEISNSVPLTRPAKNGLGTGIDNVKHRLNIIYPKQHKLTIQNNSNIFTVHLEIYIK